MSGTQGRGGLHLQDLLDRCAIDLDTGCWRWKGAASAYGTVPMVHVPAGSAQELGEGSRPARRVAWQLAGGKLPKGQQVYQHGCTDPLCIAPVHAKAGTVAERGAYHRRTGQQRGDPLRSAAQVRAARTKSNTTPVEVVRQVEQALAAGGKVRQLAGEFHLARRTVETIRKRNHVHQQALAKGASVFHQA
jgi:hypothetical protein